MLTLLHQETYKIAQQYTSTEVNSCLKHYDEQCQTTYQQPQVDRHAKPFLPGLPLERQLNSWEMNPRMSTNRQGGSFARNWAAFSPVLEFQTHSQSNDHQQLLRRSIRVYGTIMAGFEQTPPPTLVEVEASLRAWKSTTKQQVSWFLVYCYSKLWPCKRVTRE